MTYLPESELNRIVLTHSKDEWADKVICLCVNKSYKLSYDQNLKLLNSSGKNKLITLYKLNSKLGLCSPPNGSLHDWVTDMFYEELPKLNSEFTEALYLCAYDKLIPSDKAKVLMEEYFELKVNPSKLDSYVLLAFNDHIINGADKSVYLEMLTGKSATE